MRRLPVLILLAASASAGAACDTADPAAFAQRFFDTHRTFYFEETPALAQAVTAELHRALRNHYRCIEKEGLCHLDYDPWLGAQDGDIAGTPTFTARRTPQGGIEVAMRYRFVLNPGEPGAPHEVVLRLQQTAPPQCWRVSDLITPLGDALAARYRGKP